MQKFTCRVATLVVSSLVLATAALPAAAATNLLANPGFEDPAPGHPWMPAGWDTSQSGLPSVFFGRDTLAPHGGQYSVNVANVSTRIPMAHNWSQALLVGPESWNKDVVFSVWTRSNGLEGRAYVLVQAYRDTASKMALQWGVDRDAALKRLHISGIDDPFLDLGWNRQQFSESETPWVKREVRVFVPPSVNVLFVRCGILGTGQVMFDDASLTLEPALAAETPPLGTNLLSDPGFEGDGNAWEYSVPPYENIRAEKVETAAHGGKAAMLLECHSGIMKAPLGVCQVICNRALAGKHVRFSGWVKSDSLDSIANIKIYTHGVGGATAFPGGELISMTRPWTKTTLDIDVPKDTYLIWVWFFYTTPAVGRVYFDDASFEVLGPGQDTTPPTHPTPPGGH